MARFLNPQGVSRADEGPLRVFPARRPDPFAVLGFRPEYVADFEANRFRANSASTTFDGALTHSATSNGTMVDSDGLLKWRPHNLVLNSATPATQSITVVSGADYTVECTGVSIALSGAGTGTVTEGAPVTITASTTTLTLTVTGSSGTMWAYRSDLGGMVNNPDTGNSYVPTTSAARYLPRRNHHVWDGSAWANEGVLIEPSAATNLLLNSGTLSTQTVTVTAAPHTLHFTGTGTVTLLGASTAGPLVGTGAGEQNRVSLTFTPTAGSLTLIVSGTVTNAQLEAGSVPTSYSPTAGSTATRAAETLTVPADRLPSSGGMPAAVSIQLEGRMTRNNNENIADPQLVRWLASAGNEIYLRVRDDGVYEGEVQFGQASSSVFDSVISVSAYSPGINVPFNIASRHGSTFINGAVDGTALTADTTPVALPDLSATNLQLAFSGGPIILSKFRMWAADLGDEGIAEASQ